MHIAWPLEGISNAINKVNGVAWKELQGRIATPNYHFFLDFYELNQFNP